MSEWKVEAISAHGFEQWIIRDGTGTERGRFRDSRIMAEHFAFLGAEFDALRAANAELLAALGRMIEESADCCCDTNELDEMPLPCGYCLAKAAIAKGRTP